MQLLIVGSTRAGAIECAYVRALRRFNKLVVGHFDLEHPAGWLMRTRGLSRLTQSIQAEFAGRGLYTYLRYNPAPYSAVIVFKGALLSPFWLRNCRQITEAALWVNVNPDDPFNLSSPGATNHNIVRTIKEFDLYAIWHERLIPAIKSAGCREVMYLPFAYDMDEHFPASVRDEKLTDTITFVGTWDREREAVLTEIADSSLLVHGYGWDRVNKHSPLWNCISAKNLYGDALRNVTTSSKASLNLLRPQNYGGHNMRTFEIPAMRGLMVTTFSQAQGRFFPDGESSLMFSHSAELRQIVQMIVREEIDCDAIRAAAFSSSRGHSYLERAQSLVETIKSLRG